MLRRGAALHDMMSDDLVFIDVRTPGEFADGRAVGTVNIPLGELGERIDELDDSIDLVLCERGTRSAEALRLLLDRGIGARYLSGGLRWLAAMRRKGDKS